MTAHVIYKYGLPGIEGRVTLKMPEGATIMHVASVNDIVCVWVRVKPDRPVVDRTLALVGTGSSMEPEVALGLYIGSAITLNGRLVWHAFDLGTA